MFKELAQLVKMLFKGNPKNAETLSYLCMEHFPFKGYLYMMWCGQIVYREENALKVMQSASTDKGKIDLNHETIHLRQAQTKGSWVSYYLSYLWEWVKANPFSNNAYYLIPYEIEAYANESNFSYTENYNSANIKKYQIPLSERRKLYKQAGNTSYSWKRWLTTEMKG